MKYVKPRGKYHRLVLSRFPPVDLFEFADSYEEAMEFARIEGLTNDRLLNEAGNINLVPPEDWVSGPGSTPLMAAFTHPGQSRFSNERFGCYYASDTVATAIAETRFHRERFLRASNEAPCAIHYRQYTATVKEELVDITGRGYSKYLNPDISTYPTSQTFALKLKEQNEWGIHYPSLRNKGGLNIGVLRPKALSIPVQAGHYEYVWDGNAITEVFKLTASK